MKKIFFLLLTITSFIANAAKITSTPSGNLIFTETTKWGDEVVINFRKCMANNLYTFYNIRINGKELNSSQYSDNIGPFLVNGFWTGGNHYSENSPTANTLDYTIQVDGKSHSKAFNVNGSVLHIEVENELLYSDGKKFATEHMTYVVSGNSIEVYGKHIYEHPDKLNIESYCGMQSMFIGETEALLPDSDILVWRSTSENRTDNEINLIKSSAPNFCTFIEHNSNGYQASYMMREGLGNRDWVSDNDMVYTRDKDDKSFHKLISNHTVKRGDSSTWHGIYSWFSKPISDNCQSESEDHIFKYGAYINGTPTVMSLNSDGSMDYSATDDRIHIPTGVWKTIGKGEYYEDVFTLIHWVKDAHWPVTVEESVDQPGWYRLVAYGDACPSEIIKNVLGDPDNESYMYINATNPEKAYIALSTFGNKYQIGSYVQENGFDANKYLTFENGIFSAPDSGIAYRDLDKEENWLLGNFFQNFKLSIQLNYQILDENAKTVAVADNTNLSGDIVIPAEININGETYTVTEISNSAFKGSSITSVTLPSTLEIIGDRAFDTCEQLSSVTFGENVKTIGDCAFLLCTSLTEITIPNSLKTLNNSCFQSCENLTKIQLGTGVESIGEWSFGYCKSLSQIILPSSVKTIGKGCFAGCSSLTELIIPDAVTSIGANCFGSCPALKNIISLNITPPAVEPGDHDSEMANKTLKVPADAINAYQNADFWKDFGKIEAYDPSIIEYNGLRYRILDENAKTVEVAENPDATGDIVIPAEINLNGETYAVKALGYRSFYRCTNLTSVVIPEGVTEVGFDSFSECTSLASVTLPSTLTTLGGYAFHNCQSLTAISIPSAVTSIGEYCFAKCQALTSIELPDNITQLPELCFFDCNSLTSVILPSKLVTIGDRCFDSCSALPSILIPEGVTTIGKDCFHNCESFTELIVPNSVTTIDENVFYGCKNLKNIQLSESLQDLKKWTFRDCFELDNVIIPNSVTTIGEAAFSVCGGLSTILLGENVELITKGNFSQCYALINVISLNPTPPVFELENLETDFNPALATLKVPESAINAYSNADVWKDFGRIKVYHEGMDLYEFDRAEPVDGSAFYETVGLPETIDTYWQDITSEVVIHEDAALYNESDEMVGEIKLKQSADNLNLIKLELGKLSLAAGRYTVAIESGAFGDADEEWINEEVRLTYLLVEAGALMPPAISYNGRYATISSEEDANIEYSINGGDYQPYTATFDVDGLSTVRAYARKADYWDSQVAEYKVLSYGTENRAEISDKGSLAEAYAWADIATLNAINNLTVSGYLRSADYQWLRERSTLTTLDLSAVTVKYGYEIPSRALERLKLTTVAMPSSINNSGHIGEAIFAGNTGLTAIIWELENIALPRTVFDGIDNANLLLYVPVARTSSALSTTISNIIIGGVAHSITLSESAPWGCPREFTAWEVNFSRNFSKQTAIDGGCAGWETIALPFDVQTVSYANGSLDPFAASSDANAHRFWLYKPDSYEWQAAAEIEANVPYLIAMPNNPAYYEPFNITGEVTFSADNVVIPATPADLSYDYRDGYRITANYVPAAADSKRLVVNDKAVDGHEPGSCFVADERAVRPFEAYLTAPGQNRVPIFSTTSLTDGLMAEMALRVWSDTPQTVSIFAPCDASIKVYDIAGRTVRSVKVDGGKTVRIADLPAGIYIIARTKIAIIR